MKQDNLSILRLLIANGATSKGALTIPINQISNEAGKSDDQIREILENLHREGYLNEFKTFSGGTILFHVSEKGEQSV